jgi:prepilin peptidase CpaA
MSFTVLAILLAKLVVVIAMVVAAGVDISRRIVPNETVLAVLAGGLLIRLLSPQEPSIWLSVGAALVVLAVLGLVAHGGFMGGGDVKLISAATLAEPLRDVLPLLLHIALAGGVVAAFYLVRGLVRSLRDAAATGGEVSMVKFLDFKASIPYSVSVLLGVMSLHAGKAIQ